MEYYQNQQRDPLFYHPSSPKLNMLEERLKQIQKQQAVQSFTNQQILPDGSQSFISNDFQARQLLTQQSQQATVQDQLRSYSFSTSQPQENQLAIQQLKEQLMQQQLQTLGLKDFQQMDSSRRIPSFTKQRQSFTQQENNNIQNSRAGPRIFVGKLSKDVNEQDVKDCFTKFGYVLDVYLPKNKDNKQEHRGFGFITFETEASVQRVVAHGVHKLKGQVLAIDVAIPRKEDVQSEDFNLLHGQSFGLQNSVNPAFLNQYQPQGGTGYPGNSQSFTQQNNMKTSAMGEKGQLTAGQGVNGSQMNSPDNNQSRSFTLGSNGYLSKIAASKQIDPNSGFNSQGFESHDSFTSASSRLSNPMAQQGELATQLPYLMYNNKLNNLKQSTPQTISNSMGAGGQSKSFTGTPPFFGYNSQPGTQQSQIPYQF